MPLGHSAVGYSNFELPPSRAPRADRHKFWDWLGRDTSASWDGMAKSSNAWHNTEYCRDRARIALLEFDKAFKGPSRGPADDSSSASSDFHSACDENIGGSGELSLSFSENTNLSYLPTHGEASEEAFHGRFLGIVRWYQECLARWARQASPNQEDENYRSSTGTAHPKSTQSQHQQQRRGKRKRQDDEHHSEGGYGGGNDGYGRLPVNKSRDTKIRLACPFFKRDPEKYADHQYCLHHWPTTSRLKEHLYQKHMLSGIQCGLCGVEFNSQPSFHAHQREPGACERPAFKPLEGIDVLTKMRLQDKRVARGAPEWEKWIAIYAILFPHDDPATYPDPYYDLLPTLRQQVTTLLQDEIPEIVQNAINQVTNNIEAGATPYVNELQDAIKTSIKGSLQRFRSQQASLLPIIGNAEGESGGVSSRPVPSTEGELVIPHSPDQVFMEGFMEAASSETTEALLQQFQADLGDDQTFANTHETELGQLLDYYCNQVQDSSAIQPFSDEENEGIEWLSCNGSLTKNP